MNRTDDHLVNDAEVREVERLVREAARADANAARVDADRSRQRTLEDRVFASTHLVLSPQTEVIARIGPSRPMPMAWKIAAAVGLLATLSVVYTATRPAATTGVTGSVAANGSADVEYVLAAVSLLDEPLNGGLEDLAEDAARLHELVASDRTFGTEQPAEEKPGTQGV